MPQRIMNPITTIAEDTRHNQSRADAFSAEQNALRHTFGTIQGLDSEGKPAVIVYDDSGQQVAGGSLIPLNYPSERIPELWGTIRIGMRVLVLFTGPDGGSASAFIVGTEGEKNLNSPVVVNDAERGLFAVFSPGITG
jgi:hypothetical protein